MIEEEFKAVRRRYYQLGKGRHELLINMGYLDPAIMGPEKMRQHDEKRLLMKINMDGFVDDLVRRINEREESQVLEKAGLPGRVETERGPVSER